MFCGQREYNWKLRTSCANFRSQRKKRKNFSCHFAEISLPVADISILETRIARHSHTDTNSGLLSMSPPDRVAVFAGVRLAVDHNHRPSPSVHTAAFACRTCAARTVVASMLHRTGETTRRVAPTRRSAGERAHACERQTGTSVLPDLIPNPNAPVKHRWQLHQAPRRVLISNMLLWKKSWSIGSSSPASRMACDGEGVRHSRCFCMLPGCCNKNLLGYWLL